LPVIAITSCSENDIPQTPTTGKLLVANGQQNTVEVIDMSTDEVVQTVNGTGSWPHHIYQSPDKSRFIVSCPGMDMSQGHDIIMNMPGAFTVIDAGNFSIVKTQSTPQMNHNAIYSPDGTQIWTGQMDTPGTVLVYDASDYSIRDTIAVGMQPLEVTLSPDKKYFYCTNGMSDDISVIDIATRQVVKTIPLTGEEPVGAWPCLNGYMFADCEKDGIMNVIDPTTKSVSTTFTLGFTPGMLAYSTIHNELWIADATNGSVHYFRVQGGQWTDAGNIATGVGAHGVAFSPDERKCYVSNQMDGTVSVIDVEKRTKTKDISINGMPNGMCVME